MSSLKSIYTFFHLWSPLIDIDRNPRSSSIIVDHRRSIDIDRSPRQRRSSSIALSLYETTPWQTRNTILSFSIFSSRRILSSCFMSSRREQLYRRVKFKGVTTMMFCQRCVSRQLKCCLSSLFKKCAKCIRTRKRCESIVLVMNFDAIDRALAKLEEEELKMKAIQLIATKQLRTFFVKLQRLKKQKRFLREKEQKMFDKELSNVKELKRLKDLEQTTTLKQLLSFAIYFNDFVALFSNSLR